MSNSAIQRKVILLAQSPMFENISSKKYQYTEEIVLYFAPFCFINSLWIKEEKENQKIKEVNFS